MPDRLHVCLRRACIAGACLASVHFLGGHVVAVFVFKAVEKVVAF